MHVRGDAILSADTPELLLGLEQKRPDAGAQDGPLRITDDGGDLGYRLYGVGVLASQKKEP